MILIPPRSNGPDSNPLNREWERWPVVFQFAAACAFVSVVCAVWSVSAVVCIGLDAVDDYLVKRAKRIKEQRDAKETTTTTTTA